MPPLVPGGRLIHDLAQLKAVFSESAFRAVTARIMPGTINLPINDPLVLDEDADLTLEGASGLEATIIDGGGLTRLIIVRKRGRLRITGVVLRAGSALPGFGGGLNVEPQASVTLHHVTIDRCTAFVDGDDFGHAYGGGVYVSANATVRIVNSVINGSCAINMRNLASARAAGGGVYSLGTVSLHASTVRGCCARTPGRDPPKMTTHA